MDQAVATLAQEDQAMTEGDDLRAEFAGERWDGGSSLRLRTPHIPATLEFGAGKDRVRLSVAFRHTIPVAGAAVAGLAPALTVWSPSLQVKAADSPTAALAVICAVEIVAGMVITVLGLKHGKTGEVGPGD
jgi:hypothetical protein